MLKRFLFVWITAIFFSSLSFAQDNYVRGTVYDAKTGETMPGVAIVVSGTSTGTTTDLDGKFNLKVEPGTYKLEISFISYETILMENTIVKPGTPTVLPDIMMNEEGFMLSEVTVAAKEVRNTENSLVAMKRNSVNVIDGISAAGFKKMGDSDAASSMKRVSGVSVTGGKYIFVRGLGDRYTKTILNGTEIPGLDPDRNTIQMDIFPTNIIDNIIVNKTFSAELPADFTGGIVNIETKDFPDEKTANISIGTAYNPGAHFNSNYLSYQGGKLDFLGFDDGTRAIPAITNIPQFAEVVGNPDGEKAQRYKEILSSFNPNMAAQQQKSLMDFDLGANYGNQTVRNKYTIGYTFSLSYKNTTDFFENTEYGRYGLTGDKSNFQLDRRELQIGSFGVNNIFLSGLAGLAFKTRTSKVRFNIMHLQNGESKAGIFDYYKTSLGSNFDGLIHTLDYSQRGLTNIILDGTHNFKDDLWKLEWKLSPTLSTITEPDVRFTRYEDREGVYSISTESGFPERIWRELKEFNVSALANVTREYRIFDRKAKLNFGMAGTYKQRDFIIRNFAINIRDLDLTGDPNEIFAEENLWPYNGDAGSGTTYETPFIPVNPNKFSANVNSEAIYISTEISPLPSLKTIFGIRTEKYMQRYTGRDQLGYHILDNDVVLDEIGFFPTINIIYSLNEKQNFRIAASKTTARPSFKELSYAEIFDPITGRTFIGGLFRDANDLAGVEYWDGNLMCTDIYNYDFRWELFMNNGQFVSISGFRKDFINPIEIVQFATQIGAFQPRNVGDGQVYGAEAELKLNLGFISDKIKTISITTNYTITESRIELSKTEYDSRTENARNGQTISQYRDMAGQAPSIVNAGISFKGEKAFWQKLEAGVFYNVQGRTLLYAGIADRPDIYSEPFHSLNFNANFTAGSANRLQIGFKVDNILNSKQESVYVSYMADDQYFSRLSAGRTFSFKLSYKLL